MKRKKTIRANFQLTAKLLQTWCLTYSVTHPKILASSSTTFPLEMAQVDINKNGKLGNDKGNKSS